MPGSVEVVSPAEVKRYPGWASALAGSRKDHRYYEIVAETIRQGFEFRYFVLRDSTGEICAIQPFFLLDQDLLAGSGPRLKRLAETVRRRWPRFLLLRTLMVGCAAGEGHLDGADDAARRAGAQLLSQGLVGAARDLGARLVVLKEFPAACRDALVCFVERGFARVPSFPMTRLAIDHASFEDYMVRALSSKTRKDLRKKLRIAAAAPPIEMAVMSDIAPVVDEVYPLYLKVYERAQLRFEKLTPDYFVALGRRMPDRVRYFVWRQQGRVIAFSLCMLDGEAIYAEYLGLDYPLALDLHLYHYVFRDVVTWAMANGFQEFRSSGLNYDPKLHLRHRLDPLDLYVRHTSSVLNVVLRLVLPLIEPTRHDKTLRQFSNYHELWGRPAPSQAAVQE